MNFPKCGALKINFEINILQLALNLVFLLMHSVPKRFIGQLVAVYCHCSTRLL